MKTSTTAAAAAGSQPVNASSTDGEKKSINPELWQACAGPLVSLPAAGTHVVYFPQGHSEQVAASMRKDMDAQIPNYPNLPSKMLCLLHSVTLHADPETDEVYAQMTLQPVLSFDREALLRSDLSTKASKPQTEFFCKTLTASDTSTHGGFSVPRRSAEKIFPALDFTMQPPAQELMAKDLHDNAWTFRHIYRGQPKRHLLTTGWSLFVSGKRLFAGDSVLFIRDEKQQLLLGTRRANRQPTNLSSSVLSSDSMHIGILAAAAHAAANTSPFTVFYNPRASPSEFVIPLAKYYKAVCNNQISLGMRFRMMFETEESGTRRYMGTITGISDLDPLRWKNSQWRNLQVGWDESTAGERRNRVSIWDIEPVTAPFFMCPSPPFFCAKRPRQPGMPDDDSADLDNIFRRTMPWMGDDYAMKDPQAAPSLSLAQWMNMQQTSPLNNMMQQPYYSSPISSSLAQSLSGAPTNQISQPNNIHQLPVPSSSPNPLGSIPQPQPLLTDITQPSRQKFFSQALPTSQVQTQVLPSQNVLQQQQQQQTILNHQLQRNISQNLPQQQVLSQSQLQNSIPSQPTDCLSQQLHMSENQIQLQLLQRLHQQQQQALLAQQSSQPIQLQDHQKQLLDVPPNFPTTNVAQQTDGNSSHRFSIQQKLLNQLQQPGMLSEVSGHGGICLNPLNKQISAGSSSVLTGAAFGGHSAVTDDLPSCSTSLSTNNCSNPVQSTMNGRNEISHSSSAMLSSTGLESLPSNGNSTKDFQTKPAVKSTLNISSSQNQIFLPSQAYINNSGAQVDYLDSSSSATSVISHNEAQLHRNSSICFNSQSVLFRDANHEAELQDDPRNVSSFGQFPMIPDVLTTKEMVGSGKDFSNNASFAGGILSGYDNPKEPQHELSSSIVSQSFGVPDIAFNSIDSTINDGSFVNRGAWAPPQIPRMRTYTKVYKRGAVGRSIDMMRYSGYDELKQDLARRFGIEGQLEDWQRVGWKLVYVDHENDVLLLGDDPWEEFVNCVRCIKILSPQEVQQMSLDGDLGNSILQNPDCSSSDNGVN